MSDRITIEDEEYVHLLKVEKALDKFKKRWDEINVDLDAPEDCVKMCITMAHYFRDGSLYG